MYRIFCESYRNYVRTYEQAGELKAYRYLIAKPLALVVDLEKYQREKAQNSIYYKQLMDLLYHMGESIEKYPKLQAFLWTLESRGMIGKYYGTVKPEDLEEQVKLVNMFLNLVYWDENAA